MPREDFVNVSTGGGKMREVRLSDEDNAMIRDNPNGLTKEGCVYKIYNWSNSKNSHVLLKYLAMFRLCKNFVESKEFPDKSILLSKRKHLKPSGIKEDIIHKETFPVKNKEEQEVVPSMKRMKKLVEDKLVNLRFLTKKGL